MSFHSFRWHLHVILTQFESKFYDSLVSSYWQYDDLDHQYKWKDWAKILSRFMWGLLDFRTNSWFFLMITFYHQNFKTKCFWRVSFVTAKLALLCYMFHPWLVYQVYSYMTCNMKIFWKKFWWFHTCKCYIS